MDKGDKVCIKLGVSIWGIVAIVVIILTNN